MDPYRFNDGREYYLFDDLRLSKDNFLSDRREYVKENRLSYDIDYFLARQEDNEWISLEEDQIVDDVKMFIRVDCIDISLDQAIEALEITTKIAALYVLRFGYVKDIKEELELDDYLDDDSTVMLYGVTDDLLTKLKEHQEDYENSKIDINAEMYCHIIASCVSLVEFEAKCFFVGKECLISNNRNNNYLFAVKSKIDVLSALEAIASRCSTNSNILEVNHKKEMEVKTRKLNEINERTHKVESKALKKVDEFKSREFEKINKEKNDVMILIAENREREIRIEALEDKIRALRRLDDR